VFTLLQSSSVDIRKVALDVLPDSKDDNRYVATPHIRVYADWVVPILIKLLADEDCRRSAALCLRAYVADAPHAIPVLVEHLEGGKLERDDEEAIALTLAEFGPAAKQAVPVLKARLTAAAEQPNQTLGTESLCNALRKAIERIAPDELPKAGPPPLPRSW
jgi:hypothetical protein